MNIISLKFKLYFITQHVNHLMNNLLGKITNRGMYKID